MNTQKLLDPEVREIAIIFAMSTHNAPELPIGMVLNDKWADFKQKHTRKPIFKTCIEDGEQEVFNGEEYFFIRNDTYLHSDIAGFGSGEQKDILYFKSHENAVNYLCKNYKFTVEEISKFIKHFYGDVKDEKPHPIERNLYNEAKKRLNL